jgi:hypothetical protein
MRATRSNNACTSRAGSVSGISPSGVSSLGVPAVMVLVLIVVECELGEAFADPLAGAGSGFGLDLVQLDRLVAGAADE